MNVSSRLILGLVAGFVASPTLAMPIATSDIAGASTVIVVRDRCGPDRHPGPDGPCRPKMKPKPPAPKPHPEHRHKPRPKRVPPPPGVPG